MSKNQENTYSTMLSLADSISKWSFLGILSAPFGWAFASFAKTIINSLPDSDNEMLNSRAERIYERCQVSIVVSTVLFLAWLVITVALYAYAFGSQSNQQNGI